MKIDISNEQFGILLNALSVSAFVYGSLFDMGLNKYKKQNEGMNDAFDYLSNFVSDFGFKKEVRMFANGFVFKR